MIMSISAAVLISLAGVGLVARGDPVGDASAYLKHALKEAADMRQPLGEAADVTTAWERKGMLVFVARMRYRCGDIEAAREMAAGISLEFDDAWGYWVLVDHHVAAGEVDEALALMEKVPEGGQRDSILFYIVNELAVKGDVERAETLFKKLRSRISRPMAKEQIEAARTAAASAAGAAPLAAAGRGIDAAKAPAEAAAVRSRRLWMAVRLLIERGDLRLAEILASAIENPTGRAAALMKVANAHEERGTLAETLPLARAAREAAKPEPVREPDTQWGNINRVEVLFGVARFEAKAGRAEEANHVFQQADRLATDSAGSDDTTGFFGDQAKVLDKMATAVEKVQALLALDRRDDAIRIALQDDLEIRSGTCLAAIAKWHAERGDSKGVKEVAALATTAENRARVWLGAAEGFLKANERADARVK